jgi:transcriptional regulator GlxA family with amidase domain
MSLRPGEIAVASADKAFLIKVVDAVEARMGDERFDVAALSGAVGLSPRQLHRKLRGLADTSPVDFIRTYRLRRAMDLLRKDSTTVAEIAYSVGFGSPAYFTRCFQEQFGMTPTEARSSREG